MNGQVMFIGFRNGKEYHRMVMASCIWRGKVVPPLLSADKIALQCKLTGAFLPRGEPNKTAWETWTDCRPGKAGRTHLTEDSL